jgi:hypothetical protein
MSVSDKRWEAMSKARRARREARRCAWVLSDGFVPFGRRGALLAEKRLWESLAARWHAEAMAD